MSVTENFLTDLEEKEIVHAIQEAENMTSGEIRVHIEAHSGLNAVDRAKEVFFRLQMQNTAARNGVLFYIGVEDHSFAIVGDEGIHQVVDEHFWEKTKDVVLTHFKDKAFKKGLVEGILTAGLALKKHFPLDTKDQNELSNEISKG